MHRMMRRSLQTQMQTAQAALVSELLVRLKNNLQGLVAGRHGEWYNTARGWCLDGDTDDEHIFRLSVGPTFVRVMYHRDPWDLSRGLLSHTCTPPTTLLPGQRMDDALLDLTNSAQSAVRAAWHTARVGHQ